MQSISFFGAARTVTGSRHLLTLETKHVLVDCGLFQGDKELRARNWEEFPFPPERIDAMIATHAHLDHIGWIPRLAAAGFSGPIYAAKATIGLARISLADSARLQEEEANHRNRHGLTNHRPALPLYTEEQAYAAMRRFVPVPYFQNHDLPGGASFEFMPAGHILGSAFAAITLPTGDRLLMSGDLGRKNTPIIRDPTPIESADYLVVESTYGDRVHPKEEVLPKLGAIIRGAMDRGSVILVPSFSIGRTQELLYYLRLLEDAGNLPRIPVFIDSPMAVSTTELYRQATDEFDQNMKDSVEAGRSELEPDGVSLIHDRNQSKELNSRSGPMMVIAGSGMANGGRILHHLLHRLSDPSTIVLFTGYQADGTLGRRLIEGEPEVRVLGHPVPVRARIEKLNALSAHADSEEILDWLSGFKRAPRQTFIVHGEPPAQEALAQKIEGRLGWPVTIPSQGETFSL